jgi:hypothetical protein
MANPAVNADQASGSKAMGVFNPDAGFLNAEARRTLSSPTYGTAPSTVQVQRDTVVKRMMIKLILSTSVTYAAGSPATSHQGVFDRVCPRVELNVNGNRIVKSVRPHIARLNTMLTNGCLPRRAYYFSAAAATVTRAQREWMAGVVAYPVTTQFMLFNEAFELNFENPWGYGGSRYMTELDIRDVASCDLWFYWANMTNLQEDGVGATVTYGSQSVTVVPQIIENRARPRPQAGQVLFDYVETSFARTYTGQANNQQIDLQTGNYLMGLGIYVNNGDTNMTPASNLLQQVSLMINGSSAIQGPVAHADLLDSNQMRFGVDSPLGIADYASTIASTANVEPLQGFGHMNLIRNGDWNTAINTSRQAGVDAVKLQFNTPASSGTDAATYTNPLQVTVHTHEIRPFVYTR